MTSNNSIESEDNDTKTSNRTDQGNNNYYIKLN